MKDQEQKDKQAQQKIDHVHPQVKYLSPEEIIQSANRLTSTQTLIELTRRLDIGDKFTPSLSIDQDIMVVLAKALPPGVIFIPHPNTPREAKVAMAKKLPWGVIFMPNISILEADMVAMAKVLPPRVIFRPNLNTSQEAMIAMAKELAQGVVFMPYPNTPKEAMIAMAKELKPGVIFRPNEGTPLETVVSMVGALQQGVVFKPNRGMQKKILLDLINAIKANIEFDFSTYRYRDNEIIAAVLNKKVQISADSVSLSSVSSASFTAPSACSRFMLGPIVSGEEANADKAQCFGGNVSVVGVMEGAVESENLQFNQPEKRSRDYNSDDPEVKKAKVGVKL